jgi:hypothetical protein
MGDIASDGLPRISPGDERQNRFFHDSYSHVMAGEERTRFRDFLPKTSLKADRYFEISPAVSQTSKHSDYQASLGTALPTAQVKSDYDFNHAPTVALAARFAYLSLSGKLDMDKQTIEKTLAKAGPVGEQVLQRMKVLESEGWTFAQLTFNEAGLKEEHPNPFKRLMYWFNVGGYNDKNGRRIRYGNPLHTVSSVVGLTYGSGDPRKEAATVMAHEISHSDGIITGENKDYLPERQIFAKRLLATEARAILTQLQVGQSIGANELTADLMHEALRRKDLGGFIYDNWRYKQFNAIDRKEAVTFANEYIEKSFGPDIVDTETGKVRSFDIDAGLNEQIGSTSWDHLDNGPKPREMKSPVNAASEITHAGSFSRWARNIFALGTLATVSDLKGAFQQGPAEGFARTSRAGTDWAGFEAGNCIGAQAGKIAIRFLAPPVARMLLPIVAIGTGCYLSTRADQYLGREFESTLREILSDRSKSG